MSSVSVITFDTGRVKGDGEASIFADPDDTGIPSLQQYCQKVSVSFRDDAADLFSNQLVSFLTEVEDYVELLDDVNQDDLSALRDKWESGHRTRKQATKRATRISGGWNVFGGSQSDLSQPSSDTDAGSSYDPAADSDSNSESGEDSDNDVHVTSPTSPNDPSSNNGIAAQLKKVDLP